MARRFLTDLDLTGFAVLGALLNPTTSNPAGLGVADAGRVWFRSDTKRLMFWDGTAAIDVMDITATHGNITASRISDLATTVKGYRLDEFAAPTGPLSAGGQRVTNVADPTSAADAASRQWVVSQLEGLTSGQVLKGTVRVATTTNVPIATPGATIDGITLAANDVVLLAGQTAPAQNGPWVWTAAGSPLTRPENWNSDAEAVRGSYWIVREGSNADVFALLANDAPVTLGTTALNIIFRGAAGATYTAGNGLTLAGTEFNVGGGVGISVTADAIAVDTTRVLRKWQGAIPTASGTVNGLPITVAGGVVTFNHAAGNVAPMVVVRLAATGQLVEVDDGVVDANNVSITLPAAPTSGQYNFMVAA